MAPTPTTRVLAVANQKGGTGKSTIAVNVAVAVGETGMRMLLVDVDPQADATTMLGVDPADARTPCTTSSSANANFPTPSSPASHRASISRSAPSAWQASR